MKLNKKILSSMLRHLEQAPAIYQPSDHWRYLNKIHLQQIGEEFEEFKRTINMRYFNWGTVGILAHQLRPIFREIVKKRNFNPITNSSFQKDHARNNFNPLSKLFYRIYVASLFDFVGRVDSYNLLSNIEEPVEGMPHLIRYRGRDTSQDLCNSIFEFYSATYKISNNKNLEVGEIGAGYGRLAFVFLKANPNTKYTIIDIAPALYVSQEYLLKIFPKEKTFTYREFKSFKDVAKEYNSARIRFMTADQIELLPNKIFNLIVTVSTLHEMTPDQISHYINQSDRLCRDFFYFKQWKKALYKESGYIKEDEYPIPPRWKKIYHRRHKIQRMFFEALYKVR